MLQLSLFTYQTDTNHTSMSISKTDYTTWSIDELKKELKLIEKTIKLKETNERKHVLAELKAVARRSGYSLEEFLALEIGNSAQAGAAKAAIAEKNKKSFTKKRAPAKIKYRSPLNEGDTWTGRGRKPKWVADFLEHGGTLEEIAIA